MVKRHDPEGVGNQFFSEDDILNAFHHVRVESFPPVRSRAADRYYVIGHEAPGGV